VTAANLFSMHTVVVLESTTSIVSLNYIGDVMTKRAYTKREKFTEEQENIILDNYQSLSAGEIIKKLKATDETKEFNEQMIYTFLRRVKREAEKSYQLLIKTNELEAAEKLKTQTATIIPDKRGNSNTTINKFLDRILKGAGE